jgi:hypothetical protein
MRGRLGKYLLGILILIVGFIAYEVLRTKAIFNNSKTVNIIIHEKPYLQIINAFGLEASSFHEKVSLDEKDTILSFESKNHVCLLWVISDHNNIDMKNCSFQIKDLNRNEDGTYANYVSDAPLLSISYRKKRNIDLGSHPIIYLSTDVEPIFIQKQHNSIWQISDQYSIEFRNSKSQLVYRTDFTYPTEVFLFNRANSLNAIFMQKTLK